MAHPDSSAKILVADDDAGLARLIDRALQTEGFRTATVSSGQDAIAWLAAQRADLLLLDLRLRDLTGKEVIDRLAAAGTSLPYIIITGQGNERVAVEMMKHGALDYLVKDLDFIDFVGPVVKSALSQLEKERRLTFAEERASLALTVIEESHSSVLITTTAEPDPEIVFVNPAFVALTGVFASEIVGRPLSALEERTGPWGELRRALRAKTTFAGEVTLRAQGGEVRVTDCHISSVIGQSGQYKHWIVTQRDVTRNKQLEADILEVSDAERRRIGRDLHDGLGQHLTALELLSQTLVGKLAAAAPSLVAPAQYLTRQIRETIVQTRLLSHNLSPVPVAPDGLMLALAELAAGTEAMTGVKCRFICATPVLVTDASVADHVYRIAQEAVHNALKHSGARALEILLEDQGERARLLVEDDGRGLTTEAQEGSGLGMRTMRYRARLILAELTIESTASRGTRVVCVFRKEK